MSDSTAAAAGRRCDKARGTLDVHRRLHPIARLLQFLTGLGLVSKEVDAA